MSSVKPEGILMPVRCKSWIVRAIVCWSQNHSWVHCVSKWTLNIWSIGSWIRCLKSCVQCIPHWTHCSSDSTTLGLLVFSSPVPLSGHILSGLFIFTSFLFIFLLLNILLCRIGILRPSFKDCLTKQTIYPWIDDGFQP